ncbi:PilZ domain-containing protein [Pseudodesulfovibrio piezophilus]|uniref:Type IV pilus assembly PilZ n=1 Tax=Pseudodesulfovibrio piezophilus (strain DSM 21447 / JCM 15486 / C1TLV30) TaxID=1322246 RepID=M1WUK6_PSEP2|nr:PilZ domain-containing protein [Pseudodesulfovibrio piezophilus]CCH47503.1 Type IV pilus assembly PilZ [Pseudodesulfovibrio piezophilus C1TLV30]
MGFDIEMSTGGDDHLRKAFRTRVPGLSVQFPALDKSFEVKDLSATGFAVLDLDKGFKEGQFTDCELLINDKLFLKRLNAEVMRVLDNGIVGINFVDLSRQQQSRLDKLVLEVQKRLIELRKKQREQE